MFSAPVVGDEGFDEFCRKVESTPVAEKMNILWKQCGFRREEIIKLTGIYESIILNECSENEEFSKQVNDSLQRHIDEGLIEK